MNATMVWVSGRGVNTRAVTRKLMRDGGEFVGVHATVGSWRSESADGAALEVVRDGDAVRLRLCRGGVAYVDADLGDVLVVSAGRPWRPARPGVRAPEVRRTAAGLRVRCTVGPLRVGVELEFTKEGVLRAEVGWRNATGRALADLAVGLALPLPGGASADGVTLPQVLYRGNPSADPARTVPRLGAGPEGGGLVVEEHRLPVPCAHAEWQVQRVEARFLTLFALDPGDGSLGAISRDGGVRLLALSGPVMFNGAPDVAYTHKATTAPHPHGYRTLAPGAALTTRHALHWGRPSRPGHGFRDLVRQGLRLYEPTGARPLSLDRMIELKTAALDRRWREADGGVAGYVKFPGPGHVPGFMYGWTGQCLKLAWCDATLGLERAEAWRVERCRRAVDFYLKGSPAPARGLRLSFYGTEDGRWSGFERDGRPFVSSRAYGDALGDLADICELLADHGSDVPEHWTQALESGLDAILADLPQDGPVPLGWDLADGAPLAGPAGAAGLSCVLALLKAQRVVPSDRRLAAAIRLLDHYHRTHADDFAVPFAYATLDAACEDKEGGMAFFQCAYELLRLTGEARYRDWAAATADWLLTWVYQWNPPYPPGSALADRGFSAVGWPGVSIQNHHVDVFFPAHELSHFAELSDRPEYADLAHLIIHAMGQAISTHPGDWDFTDQGEQPEGIFPTNWQHRGATNTWNPSWVTAQVLSQTLRLRLPSSLPARTAQAAPDPSARTPAASRPRRPTGA